MIRKLWWLLHREVNREIFFVVFRNLLHFKAYFKHVEFEYFLESIEYYG